MLRSRISYCDKFILRALVPQIPPFPPVAKATKHDGVLTSNKYLEPRKGQILLERHEGKQNVRQASPPCSRTAITLKFDCSGHEG